MFIDYLEQYYSIIDVSGGNQIKLGDGACPFCGESRSDLRIYVSKANHLGQCFHCGKGFGAVSFIMANESCNFAKAKKILAGMDDGWATEEKVNTGEDRPLIIPPSVWVLDSPAAMKYLDGRNIPSEAARYFKLLQAVDNVRINEKIYYTKGRIIIPIFDVDGKMVSWQGRDMTGKAAQRYLFPPGFKGREYVYNANHIPSNPDYLIVSEGVFDVFGWWLAGFRNVIATFGKKMSDEQLEVIKRKKPKRLYIAWDSDADWLKYELVEKIEWQFESVKIVNLKNKDADELSKRELAIALTNSMKYNWTDKIINSLNR